MALGMTAQRFRRLVEQALSDANPKTVYTVMRILQAADPLFREPGARRSMEDILRKIYLLEDGYRPADEPRPPVIVERVVGSGVGEGFVIPGPSPLEGNSAAPVALARRPARRFAFEEVEPPTAEPFPADPAAFTWHMCVQCGAYWRLFPNSWNLASLKAGACCDNVQMGNQIVRIFFDPFDPSSQQVRTVNVMPTSAPRPQLTVDWSTLIRTDSVDFLPTKPGAYPKVWFDQVPDPLAGLTPGTIKNYPVLLDPTRAPDAKPTTYEEELERMRAFITKTLEP